MKTTKLKTDTFLHKRKQTAGKSVKPCCGTLSYIAECRGILRKTAPSGRQCPPYGSRFERKDPAL